MLRSTASKIMWVGRATVFLVGLAVILALVLGVASAAFGANGGNFILGQLNKATAITKLVGNVAGGPALHVVNNKTEAGSRALQLGAAKNKPPIVVNATAGKAINLNADKLDGKEAADFYAQGSKVDDSDKLDGKDSTALLPGGSLPYGRTIRGSYDIRDYVTPSSTRTTLGAETSAISFGYRLSSAPAVRIIKRGATPPTVCPGTTDWPQAAPGYLCVYEYIGSSNLSGHPIAYNVTRNGASLYAHLSNNSDTNVEYYTYGTWAVTGN